MAKYFKYDSGLTLLYENNKINKSTSIDIAFDCGARCDGNLAGLSHFCEHMFFTGTQHLSKQEVIKRYFDFIKVNAYTTFTDILFIGNIMTKRLPEFLTTVQDMICNSTFSKSAIEEEKKIVIQEIVKDADKHANHAWDLKKYEMYEKDYYKQGVLGNKETVGRITSKDVKNYVKKYFVKNNCIIRICSPLSFSKVKNIVSKYFETVMPSNSLKPLPFRRSKLVEGNKVCLYTKDIDKNFLSITFKLPRKGPDLKYKECLGVIANMIDDISEGVTKQLRTENSLVYSLGTDYFVNYENSYFELGTEVCSDNIKPCIDIIFEYIRDLRKNGFTQEQLDKELEKHEYYIQTRVQTPDHIKYNLSSYRFYGKFILEDETRKIIKGLTLDEVNQTMQEMFDTASIQIFVYGNATKKDIYTLKQIEKKFN